MSKLKRKIPSANALFVFESAARHVSFKEAAEDLYVTQPSVSYAIRQLEDYLGLALFSRHHRGVALTSAGKQFYRSIEEAFGLIERSLDTLQRPQQKPVTYIKISTTLATFWLLPRIDAFRMRHPEVEIGFLTTDRDIEPEKEDVDLTTQLWDKSQTRPNTWHFADEEVFPVCSPEYFKLCGGETVGIEQLANLDLIHVKDSYRQRIGWSEWFRRMGFGNILSNSSETFNDHQLLLHSVMAGQGVSLGHRHIVESLIDRGRLVKLTRETCLTGRAFYIVGARHKPLSEHAEILKNWMLAETAKFRSDD